MNALAEWEFDFDVTGSGPIPQQLMDDLMWLVAVPWAEERDLGIGGGFGPSAQRPVDADVLWHFGFGLCGQGDGRLIPRAEAGELFAVLDRWCRERGLRLDGRFGAFEEDEELPAESTDPDKLDGPGGR